MQKVSDYAYFFYSDILKGYKGFKRIQRLFSIIYIYLAKLGLVFKRCAGKKPRSWYCPTNISATIMKLNRCFYHTFNIWQNWVNIVLLEKLLQEKNYALLPLPQLLRMFLTSFGIFCFLIKSIYIFINNQDTLTALHHQYSSLQNYWKVKWVLFLF